MNPSVGSFRGGFRWVTLLVMSMAGLLCGSAWVHAAEGATWSRVFVVLEGEPLAAQSGLRAGSEAWESARTRMQAEQGRIRTAVEGMGGRVLKAWTLLNHAIFVEVPASQVDGLGRLGGVRAVVPERHHSRLLQTSVPAVGGPAAWVGPPGVTGRGIRIGIIDSGIDYMHGDLGGKGSVEAYGANNPKVIEPGTFPTSKVVGGTDLVGDDYDSSNSSTATPQPDPDPLDPAGNGHGTHVAGIAAGLGVPRGGTNYAGPYDWTVPTRAWRVAPGVAPEASLYAIKVFGRGGTTSSSTVVDALDRAADPDGNGDPVDHLDVVNLSLGSAFGTDDGYDPEVVAVKTLTGLGCVVVVSAGNEGNAAFKISSPASGASAIAVANAYDAGYATGAIAVEGPASVAGLMAAVEGSFTPPLAGMNPVRGTVVAVVPNLACDAIQNSAALSGRIALVDRGVCYFVEKVRALQAAGSIGVVVVNNVDGPPIVMGGTGDLTGFRIPAVMISKADGDRLKSALGSGVVVTLSADVGIPFPEYADSIHESSSRGPVWPTVRLKPDISAPGSSIDSAKAGSGLNPVSLTGTSMAAPHVAGAAALLRQVRRDWMAIEIKAALMNTAATPQRSVAGAPTPESRAGAGRLQVDAALKATVLVRSESAPEAVSLSFGIIHATGWTTRTQVVSVLNKGGVPVTCRLVSSNTLDQPGVVLRPMVSSVTVPARGVARFEAVLEVDPTRCVPDADHASSAMAMGRVRQGLPEASGQLWVLGGGVDVHVPWHAVVRAVGDFHAQAALAGVPPGDPVVMPLPTAAVGPRPGWVGVFQPGYTQTGSVQSGTAAGTDVVATGAASDFALVGSVADTTVSIAVVMAGPWVTPMRRFTRVDVEVDRDGNGTVDAQLSAADTGLVTANDLTKTDQSTDGFVPVLDARNGVALMATGDWNGFTPDRGDPAAFANGAMVLSVKGSDLGLTAGRPVFRYRVRTDGSYADVTSWVMFDPTRPWVDGTGAGRVGGIWQEEGLGVTGTIRRSNAIYNGVWLTDRAGVLLVHLHGRPGRQAETVRVDLGTADADADGLPDAWELAALGDMDGTMKTDRDGDGFTEGEEWGMGTDPRVWDGLTGARMSGDGVVLEWSGTKGRRYTVWRSMVMEGVGEAWRTGLVGSGERGGVTDGDVGVGSRFYRLVVEPR